MSVFFFGDTFWEVTQSLPNKIVEAIQGTYALGIDVKKCLESELARQCQAAVDKKRVIREKLFYRD